jgi:hypothetical protein
MSCTLCSLRGSQVDGLAEDVLVAFLQPPGGHDVDGVAEELFEFTWSADLACYLTAHRRRLEPRCQTVPTSAKPASRKAPTCVSSRTPSVDA